MQIKSSDQCLKYTNKNNATDFILNLKNFFLFFSAFRDTNTILAVLKKKEKSKLEVRCWLPSSPLTQTWSSSWWPWGNKVRGFSRCPSGGPTPNRCFRPRGASRHADWPIRIDCTTSHCRLHESCSRFQRCHRRRKGSSRRCPCPWCWSQSRSGWCPCKRHGWRHLWTSLETI